MKFRGVKIAAALIFAVFLLFFSNDFGLIDIEKTAIITAVAIDTYNDGEYKVTAQIAVPEATDTNTENQRAQISGTGSTVGAAIKNIGDTSGWFPQLCFCNLIAISGNFADYNIIKIVDYFSKTLRVQDSALLVMAENEAVELLKLSTPLDNVSSFALQKILLKNAGLNRDVAVCDVKTFCSGYYSDSGASFMPIVKVVSQKSENEKASAENGGGSSGGQNSGGSNSSGSSEQSSGGAKGDAIFNADTTALFIRGVKTGELDAHLTLAFNAITKDFSTTTFEVKDVESGGIKNNYLLTVVSCKAKKYLEVSNRELRLNISLNAFVKISDENTSVSDAEYIKNNPLKSAVKAKAEADFTAYIKDLVLTEINTGCDFLEIKKELYRKHHSFYSVYKDNFINAMTYSVNVNFEGQN